MFYQSSFVCNSLISTCTCMRSGAPYWGTSACPFMGDKHMSLFGGQTAEVSLRQSSSLWYHYQQSQCTFHHILIINDDFVPRMDTGHVTGVE